MTKLFKSILIVVALIVVTSCAGGGSEGTGASTRTLQGIVRSPDGSPVPDAQITILSTGDSSITDAQGSFALQTSDFSTSLQLEVEKGSTKAEATISALSVDSSSVQVTIEFNSTSRSVSVSHLDVDVKIVGMCDVYFENNRVIRQANAVPRGQRCTAKIVTRSNGKLTGNVSYALRYGGCSGTGAKTILGTGLTSVAFNPGIGQISFPYIDDAEHCLYEFVIPYGVVGAQEPIIYRLETFTKQRR
jgi:hypothetical protein